MWDWIRNLKKGSSINMKKNYKLGGNLPIPPPAPAKEKPEDGCWAGTVAGANENPVLACWELVAAGVNEKAIEQKFKIFNVYGCMFGIVLLLHLVSLDILDDVHKVFSCFNLINQHQKK